MKLNISISLWNYIHHFPLRKGGTSFSFDGGIESLGKVVGDVAAGGKDAHKLDVVFLIKIPKKFLEGARGVPGRETIKIVPPEFLMEKGEHHYLQKEKIVKGYILKRDVEPFNSR